LLHAGTPSSAALRELKQALPANLSIRRCPRLHAKAVVVDARGMYLGSANLTGAGLGAKADGRRNFELGVWTQSPALIDAVLEHFNALWEGHQCKGCRRKDVCPVPLEEPRLSGDTRAGRRVSPR
jgi:phosphatidylserine/phosphatidylglycerophosphate/cardiolipin synthase-like enzyme